MDKILSIVGSTGTGKSALAVLLAKQFNGEVISADSMQVYKGMDIGTAKITQEEMDGVIHHLVDIQEIDQPYNVKLFQEKSRQAIQDILSRGKLPILCGGTGLYSKAAVYDYEFSQEEDHSELLKQLDQLSNEELVEELRRKDPKSLEKIHPNNRKRLLRALVMTYGKENKSEREARQEHLPLYDVFFIGLKAEKLIIDQRIEKRVDQMFEKGLVQEVQNLFSDPQTWKYNSFQAIGYKEFQDYFENKKTLDQVQQDIVVHSRRYAKKQMTWFRNQVDVHWFEIGQTDNMIEMVKNWYEKN